MGSDDKVQVMISTDCGSTFTSVGVLNAGSGLTNAMQNKKFGLGNYAGQSVIVGILATDGTVDDAANVDFHIDNIMVRDNLFPTLAGTYTINKTQPTSLAARNFASFSAAAITIDTLGVSGAVVLNVVSGTGPYNEQVTFNAYNGASATNTVTINGNNNMLTFTPTSANRHILKLNGADYITVDNLNITSAAGAAYGWGVVLTNAADNNTIQNSTITVSSTSNDANAFSGIVASSSATVALAAGNNAANLKVLNNTISGGYNGIIVSGAANGTTTGATVTGNTLSTSQLNGIYLSNQNAPVVSRNVITMKEGSTYRLSTGINLSGVQNAFQVTRNKILNAGTYGISLVNSNQGQTVRASVVNNMIGGGFQSSNVAHGIFLQGSSKIDVYHNSVSVDDGNSGHGLTLSSGSGINIRNNSFSYTGGNVGYAIYVASASSLEALDYNNYYSTGNRFVYFNGSQYNNLNSFRNAAGLAGHDANSRSGNPGYVSATDLHATGSQLNGWATVIASVTEDYDGTARSGNPDVGADEYTPSSAREMGSGNAAPTLSSSVYPNPFRNELTLQLTNVPAGQTVVRIADLTGKIVYERSFQTEAGSRQLALELNASMPAGMYVLQVQAAEQVSQQMLMKQ